MDRHKPDSSNEPFPPDGGSNLDPDLEDVDLDDVPSPEPPYTTTRHMTSPKFGSAGSGGAELEPGPDR
jgi:hypothetical protein